MKAIISSTHDDKYLFFHPIISWCWNKIGVETLCFQSLLRGTSEYFDKSTSKLVLIQKVLDDFSHKSYVYYFSCPPGKEATYAQCSRLYAGAVDLPEHEILITSDVDMALFNNPLLMNAFTGRADFPGIQIIGSDLIPQGQYPMCYISATVKIWRKVMDIGDKSYQECLDELLGHEEMENMRGNLWSRDQETAFTKMRKADVKISEHGRAKTGTQFASRRLDRDDSFLLDHLSPDIIDYHMPRPGYEEKAFEQILTVLQYFYPNDNFQWLIDYRNEYIKLL